MIIIIITYNNDNNSWFKHKYRVYSIWKEDHWGYPFKKGFLTNWTVQNLSAFWHFKIYLQKQLWSKNKNQTKQSRTKGAVNVVIK